MVWFSSVYWKEWSVNTRLNVVIKHIPQLTTMGAQCWPDLIKHMPMFTQPKHLSTSSLYLRCLLIVFPCRVSMDTMVSEYGSSALIKTGRVSEQTSKCKHMKLSNDNFNASFGREGQVHCWSDWSIYQYTWVHFIIGTTGHRLHK